MDSSRAYVRKHLLVGWSGVLVFLTLGALLEALHGFKVGWYLNVSNETRRLMFTLAHAHGALLGLLNVAFAVTLNVLSTSSSSWLRWASACWIGAMVLLPGGFLLAGLFIHGGDPGLAVLLVPPGALLLFVAAGLTVKAAAASDPSED